jgi:ATP-dependent RNA helicase SUPV3L1/SUV3
MRALLGPTNTGKTHLALDELLAHDDGVIGFPLRLLAREAYDRLGARVGFDRVALVTGEEKIVPPGARWFACTVEAMPERGVDDRPFAFVAVDEIQLCADRERGHVFTDRLLHRRGTQTTLVLGADTIAPLLRRLFPGVVIEGRPRLSTLSFAGEGKLSRLPRRSAVVAFSVADVYAIAEEVRQHHGGAAVVTGALSPATRNAQVAMFQSGEVDVLVATDAIGMGLNLAIDHVAFAAVRKFDGEDVRELAESELAQIAGRAGRHLKDGTFGTTRGVSGFAADIVERIERSRFPPLSSLCWRNDDLDFSSLTALHSSLRIAPPASLQGLVHFGRPASDLLALERLMPDPDVRASTRQPRLVERFFEHCQIPDFEKTGPIEHAEIVRELWLMTSARDGVVDEDWLSRRVRSVDDVNGDLETLVARLARVRTLAYVAHKPGWVDDGAHWQGVTRAVEDRLSDALHERLTLRFVDRLARVVVGGDVAARVDDAGAVVVAGETIGRVEGLRFVPDAGGSRGKLQTAAAARGLQTALKARVDAVLAADDDAFDVDYDAGTAAPTVRFGDDVVGRLLRGQSRLWPRAVVVLERAGQHGIVDDSATRRRLDERLTRAVRTWVARSLPRVTVMDDVVAADDGRLPAGARAVVHALVGGLGTACRADVEALAGRPDDDARRALRRYGVRLGFLDLWTDDAFKERALRCRAALLCAWRDADDQRATLPALPPAGASSFLVGDRPGGFVKALGFHVVPTPDGPRAFRGDLVDDVAATLASHPPGFLSPTAACERLGCSHAALAGVLRLLGYEPDRDPGGQDDDVARTVRWQRGRRRGLGRGRRSDGGRGGRASAGPGGSIRPDNAEPA